jgi:DNA polymerase I
MSDTLYLIDASGYIYRAYHALPPLLTSNGTPTGAVYGYAHLILRFLEDKKPAYIAAAFDASRETFRTEEFAAYKAHRPPMPQDLAPQVQPIRDVTQAFQIPMLISPGNEADDIIASVAKVACELGLNVVILSGDKDLMQLVNDKISLFDPIRNKHYGPSEVVEKFGVEPKLITDLLGLMGDTADNLPGVPGIGEKTAAELIKTYGTLENVLASVDKISGPKRKEALLKHADDARLSKRLATLRDNVEVPKELEAYRFKGIDMNLVKPLFAKLEFSRLIVQASNQGQKQEIDKSKYKTITSLPELEALGALIRQSQECSISLTLTSQDLQRAELIGVSLCYAPGESAYIPLTHRYLGVPKQLSMSEFSSVIKPLLEDTNIKRYDHNLKEATIILGRYQIQMTALSCDVMLASYLLDADESHDLSTISQRQLGHELRSLDELLGKGKKQLNFDELELARATEYSAEQADIIFRLAKLLPPKLEEAKLLSLLTDVEHPIATLLAKIESNGVAIEVDYLRKMSQKLGEEISALEKTCHEIAGIAFNVNSPKQLQEILFEKLKLPIIKKTKTGPSTDSSVLEELDHPLTKAILELRHLSKLKGTYLDTLPEMINPRTKRLHTSFNQAVAATGRLSSVSPNLQNIPIRTEIGKGIRKAFIASPGNVIISADFNQIELRLLAHFSEDPVFVEAFKNGEDIHRRTAAGLLNKPINEVTPEERRLSKAVTFGLIYGMGAFRLKQEIGTSQSEAQAYIDKYFQRYARIKAYFEEVLEKARASGEIRTIMNRRRSFTELNNANRQLRANAERMANNSGIQGSAADIMKVAMLRVDSAMTQAKLTTRIILQVHDELVFETPQEEVEAIKALAKTQMESMSQEFQLRVPLLAEVSAGTNWADAH